MQKSVLLQLPGNQKSLCAKQAEKLTQQALAEAKALW